MKFRQLEKPLEAVHPFVLQEQYQPEHIKKLSLDGLSQYVFLIINPHFSTGVKSVIQSYLRMFTDSHPVSLVFLYEGEDFQENWLESLVGEENLAPESIPDLVILDTSSIDSKEIPSLIQSCQTFIDTSLRSDSHYLNLALLLDKQCIKVGPFAPELEVVTYCQEHDTETMGQLLQQFYNQEDLNTQVRQSFIEISHNHLVQQILNTAVGALFIWGRSGTLFMHSLLDSHPQIMALPPHPNFTDFHQQQWPRIAKDVQSFDELIARFIEENITIFDGSKDETNIALGHLGEDRATPVTACAKTFTHHMNQLALMMNRAGHQVNRKIFFLIVHYAYALTIGQDIKPKTLIIHQFHNSQNISGMKPLFEDCPHIVGLGMMRNPIKGFNSHLRVGVTDKITGHLVEADENYTWADLVYDHFYNLLYRLILMGWNGMDKHFNMPIHVVRLEDLHANPNKTMAELAKKLKIDWNDCLLESTYNGLKYWGDKSMIKQRSGFSANHPAKSSGDMYLDILDQYVLTGLLASEMEKNNYLKIPLQQRILTPLLLLIPSYIERLAFKKAFKERNTNNLKETAKQVIERWKFSLKHYRGKDIL